MKARHALAVGAAMLAFAAGSQAQAQTGLIAEFNVASSYEVTGLAMGLGYRFGRGNFALTPVAGAFIYKGEEDPRYFSQTFGSPDTTVCFNRNTGLIAPDQRLCDSGAAQAYGQIEASYEFAWGQVAAGFHATEGESSPYLGLYKSIGEKASITARAGADYYSLGVAIRLNAMRFGGSGRR